VKNFISQMFFLANKVFAHALLINRITQFAK